MYTTDEALSRSSETSIISHINYTPKKVPNKYKILCLFNRATFRPCLASWHLSLQPRWSRFGSSSGQAASLSSQVPQGRELTPAPECAVPEGVARTDWRVGLPGVVSGSGFSICAILGGSFSLLLFRTLTVPSIRQGQ